MKFALIALALVSMAQAANAADKCTVFVKPSYIGGNFGHEVGEDCPIVSIVADPGLSLALVNDDNGTCSVKSNDKIIGGLTQVDVNFDASKYSGDLDDGCTFTITDDQTGKTGSLSVTAFEN